MKKIVKVLAVTGIRSEYDLLFPIARMMKLDPAFDLKLVLSGAHLSSYHGSTYKRALEDGFVIADMVDSLFSTDRSAQRSKSLGALIQGLTQTVDRESPDLLLVVGDREESIATALVGNYMGVLVAHVGGGDPVWGNADDPVRMATSKLANIHLVTARPYLKNLISIGEDAWRIKFTGTPGLDNIKSEAWRSKAEIMRHFEMDPVDYVVVIKHPLSSEVGDAYQQMRDALTAISEFCDEHEVFAFCITPNSDPGSSEILRAYAEVSSDRLITTQTLPRNLFVNLLRHAKALAGNSSMGILEAPFYGLPVVNIGNRQQGRLNAGNVRFVGYDRRDIKSALEVAVFDDQYRARVAGLQSPYGEGSAAKITVDFLKSIDLNDRRWFVKEKLV